MKKTSKAQLVVSSLIGVIVFLALERFMARDSASAAAVSQRAWLVVGLLLGGAYVIFRSRKDDRSHYQATVSPDAIARRYRFLGLLAWVFIFVALVIGGRLVVQTIHAQDCLMKKKPNQTLEPTTLLVMPRACARVTPSRVVAHL